MESEKVLGLDINVLSTPSSQPILTEYKLCKALCWKKGKGKRGKDIYWMSRVVCACMHVWVSESACLHVCVRVHACVGVCRLINPFLFQPSLMSLHTENSTTQGTSCGIVKSAAAVSNYNHNCHLMPNIHKTTRAASSRWHCRVSGGCLHHYYCALRLGTLIWILYTSGKKIFVSICNIRILLYGHQIYNATYRSISETSYLYHSSPTIYRYLWGHTRLNMSQNWLLGIKI